MSNGIVLAANGTVIARGRDVEAMLISAERYACGRRTYCVGQTVDFIIPLLKYLSTNTLCVFDRDMQNQKKIADDTNRQDVWGAGIDKIDWMRFWTALNTELERRRSGNDQNHPTDP